MATGIEVGGGARDIVYVTTMNNSLYGFNANDAEAALPLWHVNFGTPADVHSADSGCLDINGDMVRTFAVQGLLDLTAQEPALMPLALDALRSAERNGTPAMKARSRNLTTLLEKLTEKGRKSPDSSRHVTMAEDHRSKRTRRGHYEHQ